MRLTLAGLTALLLLGAPAPGHARPAERGVTFLLTDAMVKSRRLQGVEVRVTQGKGVEQVAGGTTDGNGLLTLRLPAGRYRVTYRLPGYIPLQRSATRVRRDGQLITTALTPLLEVSGQHGRTRVQFVLSWDGGGERELNADAHIYRPDLKPPMHLYWKNRKYEGEGEFQAGLDQDATGGGGPETITILDPPPGLYAYFVHAPRSEAGALQRHNARVRVILDDSLLLDIAIPEACTGQVWRPMHHLRIYKDGRVDAVGHGLGEKGWRCRFPQANELKAAGPAEQPPPTPEQPATKPKPRSVGCLP